MSRIGITYEEVTNAAKRLQERGENPTVDRVRELLGTGSNSTIARYLRDWKTDSDKAIGNNRLPADLLTIVNGLWETIQEKAMQRILGIEQEAEQKVTAKELQLIELQKKYIEQEARIHKLEEDLNRQILENKNLNEVLAIKQFELSKLYGHSDTINKQIIDQKTENGKLHLLLNNVQKNLEHYQLSIQKLQQEQSIAIEKQKMQYEIEITQLKEKYFGETDEKNRFKLLFEQASSALEKSNHEYKTVEKNFREKEINEATLKDRYDRLAEQHQQISIILENKLKLLTEVEQKLKTEKKELLKTTQALQTAEDKIKKLRHEQLFLVEEKANLKGQIQAFTQQPVLCSNL